MNDKELIVVIRQLCQLEKARAESIIHTAETSNFKLHAPTVENHRGQLIVAKKVLSVLDTTPGVGYNRGDLLEWYVNARVDGWACHPAMPNSDNWEHAFLSKGKLKAEINIPGGTLIIWDEDGTITSVF